jgi:MSHA biogenesis protein MshP
MRYFHASAASKSQGGFAIVSAIFLLVALAVLGAVMVTFSNTQHLTSAQDVQGSRAYWAAKGGIQWAAASIIGTGTCTSGTLAFTDGFTVVVDCSKSNTYSEGTSNNTIYWVTSTASAGGGVGSPGYVERQVQAFIQ